MIWHPTHTTELIFELGAYRLHLGITRQVARLEHVDHIKHTVERAVATSARLAVLLYPRRSSQTVVQSFEIRAGTVEHITHRLGDLRLVMLLILCFQDAACSLPMSTRKSPASGTGEYVTRERKLTVLARALTYSRHR